MILRRVDDVLAGSPIVAGERVVTPRARRRGWVVGGRSWVVFRVSVRPQSVAVADHERRRTTVIPVRAVHPLIVLVAVALAVLLAGSFPRRRP
jgi:hypothetical protein